MQRTLFGKLALLIVMVGALALAGCGGDDGVSQSVHDQLQQEKDTADQRAADAATERAAITGAIAAATTAVGAVHDGSTDAQVTAARAAIAAATQAIADADNVSDDEKATNTATVGALTTQLTAAVTARQTAMDDAAAAQRMAAAAAAQRTAIATAITAARTAVNAVDNDSGDAVVTAAEAAIAAATKAISDAANVSAAEKAANTGTVTALTTQLTAAKTARQMAMDDAAEDARQATIATAQGRLDGAKAALAALGDDATDEDRLGALRMVEAEANALRDVLRMNGGTNAEIEAAVRESQSAKFQADALANAMMMAANAEQQRKMKAISDAQTALSGAETTLMELAEDASDEAKRDAQRAVQHAAAALLQALTDNDGTDDQKTAATMKRDSAKMMADDLTMTIDTASQRMAIANAIMAAQTAVAAVMDNSDDSVVTAADEAIAAATAAITAASHVPAEEKAANTGTVTALTTQLTDAKSSRMTAMAQAADAARMARIATAQGVLDGAKAAVMALAEDASYEDKLAAHRAVEMAADALITVLEANEGTAAQIQAAIRESQTARVAADALQAKITAREMAAEKARMDAINAAQMKVTEAQTAVDALEEDASDEDKNMAYVALRDAAKNLVAVLEANEGTAEQISAAQATYNSAKAEVDPLMERMQMANQRAAINTAITNASTQAAGLTDDASDAAITTAENALAAAKKAIADAVDLTDAEKAAFKAAIVTIEGILSVKKTSIMAKREADAKMMTADNAAAGKALHKALRMMPLSNLHEVTLSDAGLLVSTDSTDATDDVTLKAPATGASAGSLGNWSGMNYALTSGTGDSKVTNMALVYTNQDAAERKPFNATTSGLVEATADTGIYTIPEDATSDIKGAKFPTAGTKTFTSDQIDDVVIDGTYKGAPGKYRCEGASCTASFDDGQITMSAGWTFKPNTGAMIGIADSEYVYFGWWLRKDADGPTSASAFHGSVVLAAESTFGTVPDPTGIGGSATYTGKAAGKFAYYDPLHKSGDAGHFTADVMLTAKFADNADPTNGGVSGTINNFMAGGEQKQWSVKLNRAFWDDTTDGVFGGIDQDDDTDGDQFATTVWSINGNPAPASGSWSGMMYDEAAVGTANDGSNVPTTATGVFESEFGSTHRMVGGFGAER